MLNVADRPVPRWLHYWALLTVVATVSLLFLGAVVTTFRVGMADPVWPTTPWYLFFISWREPSSGFLIEHTHRLAGYVVGCCVIVLAAGLWCAAPRWLGKLGVAALLAVIAQGLLGGFRVLLNAKLGTDLAATHGLLAALVFSLLVVLGVLTSSRERPALTDEERRRYGRLTLMVVGVVFVQLVLGAIVRHTYLPIGPRLHLLGAFGVVAAVMWLARAVWDSASARKLLGRSVSVMVLFVVIQVTFGVEAWLSKFAQGFILELQQAPTIPQAVVRTIHFLLGSWILAASIATALLVRLARVSAPAPDCSATPVPSSTPKPNEATTPSVPAGLHAAPRLEGTV